MRSPAIRSRGCGRSVSPRRSCVAWAAGRSRLLELISEGRPGRVEHHDAQDVWNVPRRTLDQAMRDLLAAKLELRYCRHVTDIRQEGTRHLRVTARTPQGDDTALDCDAVILAHGAGSPLARRLGIDGLPLGAAAMRAYVDAPELTADRFIFSPELVPSYAWAFPLTDGVANVGYGHWRWLAERGQVRSVAQALIERQGWRARFVARRRAAPVERQGGKLARSGRHRQLRRRRRSGEYCAPARGSRTRCAAAARLGTPWRTSFKRAARRPPSFSIPA